jgi:CRISPR-associated endonuclease/helicase Cas3
MNLQFTDNSARVNLCGVALKTYSDVEYPDPFDPHRHQYVLHHSLKNDATGVFLNTAPTGGGKTLSWVVPAVTQNIDTIALYPTNALATDQEASIKKEIETLGETARVEAVTSNRLETDLQNRYAVNTNGEALSALLNDMFSAGGDTNILLTNPDTFVLLRRRMYHSRMSGADSFDMAVIDEFHRASRKEKNTILFLLDEMYDTPDHFSDLNKIVLLSATPDDHVKTRLDAMVPDHYHLNTRSEPLPVDYTNIQQSRPRKPFTEETTLTGYQPAMPPVELQIEAIEPFSTAPTILDSVEQYKEYLSDNRTVVMVDGVHEVSKLYEKTDTLLPGKNVKRIDGFKSANLQEKLETFDVLISNSAVEVGVDFDVDQIIFSGTSAATTLQRLGRLRREETIQRGIAFVSADFASKLTGAEFPATTTPYAETQSGSWYTREQFREFIKGHEYADNVPESFDWRISAPIAYYHILNRVRNSTTKQAKQTLKKGANRVHTHFIQQHETPKNTLHDMIKNVTQKKDSYGQNVLYEIQTYRSTGIQTLVYDPQTDSTKVYNLSHLLRRCNIKFVTKDELKTAAGSDHHEDIETKAAYSIGYCLFYGPLKSSGSNFQSDDEYTGRQFEYTATGSGDIVRLCNVSESDRTPELCTGLNIITDDEIPGINHLNDSLQQTKTLCYMLQMSPRDVQTRFQLDQFEFTHRLIWQDEFAISFGETALNIYCKYQDSVSTDEFKFI